MAVFVAVVLQPLFIEAEIELVAALPGAADAGPWSSWLRRSISEVSRSDTTPDVVASTEDTIFLAATDDVRKFLEALVLHLRVMEPPEIMITEDRPNTWQSPGPGGQVSHKIAFQLPQPHSAAHHGVLSGLGDSRGLAVGD